MINEYKLIATHMRSELEKKVTEYLDQGYRLHGPLVVTPDSGDSVMLRQVVLKGPNT